jgi:2-oxoisovalerate dehydrogenase E1 component alpha subunit
MGAGATLIEHVTYRAGPHSTSDDPSRYRPKDEWKEFPLGDPIERLKQHLIATGSWSDDQHQRLEQEINELVSDNWKESVSYGTMTEGPSLDPDSLFDDVFKEVPEHLRRQRDELRKLREGR